MSPPVTDSAFPAAGPDPQPGGPPAPKTKSKPKAKAVNRSSADPSGLGLKLEGKTVTQKVEAVRPGLSFISSASVLTLSGPQFFPVGCST